MKQYKRRETETKLRNLDNSRKNPEKNINKKNKIRKEILRN